MTLTAIPTVGPQQVVVSVRMHRERELLYNTITIRGTVARKIILKICDLIFKIRSRENYVQDGLDIMRILYVYMSSANESDDSEEDRLRESVSMRTKLYYIVDTVT